MGATLTDAVLQAGINYEKVVKPRVKKLLDFYPEAKTTSGFLSLLREISPQKLLNFKGYKPELIEKLALFFKSERVETEEDLGLWLKVPENKKRLMEFPHIKDKTVDYLAILVGISEVAVDRNLKAFLREAGIDSDDYHLIKKTVELGAIMLGLEKSILDFSIWKYMSLKKGKNKKIKEENPE